MTSETNRLARTKSRGGVGEASTARTKEGQGDGSNTDLASIVPYRAVGTWAATSIASSRSLQSTRRKPPICSFVSANGVFDHDIPVPDPHRRGRLGGPQSHAADK
jgi:hypothetical protein